MCLPAVNAIRARFPQARLSILAKPWVADVFARDGSVDDIIAFPASSLRAKISFALGLRDRAFDCAILFQNAFEAALLARLAQIPERIGYGRDGRSFLLTRAIPVPPKGAIPPHERYYYLELLRRAGLIDRLPPSPAIRFSGLAASPKRIVGVSPGAAYGNAKRWLPDRFAEAAAQLASAREASIALFGSSAERPLCEQIASLLARFQVVNYAGQTSLREFIAAASECEVFLTNDSGAMHIASALGVPTVAIFGATDDVGTGPTGPLARVVREPVPCSPCLLRECPIDHRCMTRVSAERVVQEALELLRLKDSLVAFN